VQGPVDKKLTKAQTESLRRQLDALLGNRKAAVDRAAKQAPKSNETTSASSMANEKANASAMVSKRATTTEAGNKVERDWDAKHGKEVQAIKRKLKQGSEPNTGVRFHAPSLVNPK